MPRHLSIVVALLLCGGGVRGGDQISYDFRAEPADPFRYFGPDPTRFSKLLPEGFGVAIPGDRKFDVQPFGLATATSHPLAGDFEATARFEIIRVDKPDTGTGAGVKLWGNTESPRTRFSVGRVELPGGRPTLAVYYELTGVAAGKGRKQYFPFRAANGGLRLTRTGTTVHFWAAEGDGEFKDVHAVELGPFDVRSVGVSFDTGRAMTALEARVTGFDVRAEEIPLGGESRRSPRSRMTSVALYVGAGLAAVAVYYLVRRRRKTPVPAEPAPPAE